MSTQYITEEQKTHILVIFYRIYGIENPQVICTTLIQYLNAKFGAWWNVDFKQFRDADDILFESEHKYILCNKYFYFIITKSANQL